MSTWQKAFVASRRWMRFLPPLVTLVVILCALEFVARSSGDSLPSPGAVLEALFRELGNPNLYQVIGVSLVSWFLGLLIAAVFGVPLGILAGRNEFVMRSVGFLVDFIRPIPPVALLPLLILLLGVNFRVTVALAAIGAFFPLFFNAMYGARDLDPVKTETAQVYRLRWIDRILFLQLPAAAPYLATGFRLASTVALLLVIGTELVIGIAGLGNAINQAALGGDRPLMFARVLIAGALGLAITSLFMLADRSILRWHESNRQVAS